MGRMQRFIIAIKELLSSSGGVRRMRTRQKRRTIREGALPLPLRFSSFEIFSP
jgi:hypothetical protein